MSAAGFFTGYWTGYATPYMPGSAGTGLAPPPPIVIIDNEVANWLAETLDVEVYPLAIPQGTIDYPVLVYTIVDGDSFYRQNGPDGMGWIRYQLDAYSNFYADSASVAEQLRLALISLIKQIRINQGAKVGAATVRWVELHRPINGYDPTGTGEDNRGMYRRMSEVTIYFDQDVSGLN
jgi:hypothetical protein